MFSTSLPASTISTAGSAHTIFDPTLSTTFQPTDGASWKISYGDGSSASGTVGTDDVNLGGIIIKNQTIELATALSPEFASGISDGLLGLAFGEINTVVPTPAATPVDNMITQQDIPATMELFTANLGTWRDSSIPSFYTFGYIDSAILSAAGASEPYYTPIDSSQGLWKFTSTSATINGTSIDRSGNTAIADTGTTLALIDDPTCKAIYAAIPGSSYDAAQQGYVFPATTTADQLPIITFAVGSQQFAVPREALAFADAGNGNVYGGIQSRGNMKFDILGDTFLKGIYAVSFSFFLFFSTLP